MSDKIIENLEQIFALASEIRGESEIIGKFLFDGLQYSVNAVQLAKENGDMSTIDISEKLEMANKLLGISLEDLVVHIVESKEAPGLVDKVVDEEAIDFILNNINDNIDDYENFVSDNSSEETKNKLQELKDLKLIEV